MSCMYAGGWTGGFLRHGGGGRGREASIQKSPMMRLTFLGVSVWEKVGGGGLFGVAESNIKPLHIAYFIFVVVYIVVPFFPF